MNAFMIFARRRRPQISAANQMMRTGDISKILSREWNAMDMVRNSILGAKRNSQVVLVRKKVLFGSGKETKGQLQLQVAGLRLPSSAEQYSKEAQVGWRPPFAFGSISLCGFRRRRLR